MMTTVKRAAVLAGILGAGLLAASNFPAAGQISTSGLPSYGSLRQACLDNNVTIGGCLIVADYLNHPGSNEGVAAFLLADWKVAVLAPWRLFQVPPRERSGVPHPPSCPWCQLYVSVFQNFLQENVTVTSIENSMGQACVKDYSDPDAQNECQQLIEQYVPAVIDSIVKEQPPNTLCEDLGYCPQ